MVEDPRKVHQTLCEDIDWVSSMMILEDQHTPRTSKAKISEVQVMNIKASRVQTPSKSRVLVAVKNETYGAMKVVFFLVLISTVIVLFEVLSSFGLISNLNAAARQTLLLKTMIKVRNSQMAAVSAMTSALVWNKELTFNSADALVSLEREVAKLRSNLVYIMREETTHNLGDYSSDYKQFSSSVQFCRKGLRQAFPDLRSCGEGASSIFTGSLEKILDQTNSQLGFLHSQMVPSSQSSSSNAPLPQEMLSLWNDETLKAIQFYYVFLGFQSHGFPDFLWSQLIEDLGSKLKKKYSQSLLSEDSISARIFYSCSVYLLLLGFLCTRVYSQLTDIGNYFFGSLQLLPINLLMTNPLISNKLKAR